MGLFDLLFPNSSKMIYRDKFREIVRNISELSDKERAYVENAFKNDLQEGLYKFEIKKRCRKLAHKTGDPLEPF